MYRIPIEPLVLAVLVFLFRFRQRTRETQAAVQVLAHALPVVGAACLWIVHTLLAAAVNLHDTEGRILFVAIYGGGGLCLLALSTVTLRLAQDWTTEPKK